MSLSNKLLPFIFLFFIKCPLFAEIPRVIISEIYRDPIGSETALGGGLSHEFVEITNISADTINFKDIFITDGIETDSIIPWQEKLNAHSKCIFGTDYLLPSQCALILDPDYGQAVKSNPACTLSIAPGTVILTVKDNDIGNGLQSDDGLLLYRGTRQNIKNVIFNASDETISPATKPTSETKLKLTIPQNHEGISIILTSFLFELPLFNACTSTITPGYFEGLKDNWFTEWQFGAIDTITNAIPCTIKCIYCQPGNQKLNWSIMTRGNLNLLNGSSYATDGLFSVSISLPTTKGDLYFQIGSQLRWLISAGAFLPDPAIRITEIHPKADVNGTEWFEITNTSHTSTADLCGWRFGNNEDTVELINSSFLLSPGECVVICKDSILLKKGYVISSKILEPQTWHILNNYKDTLCLWSRVNKNIDLICYDSKNFSDWKYESLERIDLNSLDKWKINFTSSPGFQSNNSSQNNNGLNIGPIPFTPNNDGKNDLLMLTLPSIYNATAKVCIYSFAGKKIKTFKYQTGCVYFWDGKDDRGHPAPIGPFFVYVEMTSAAGKKIFRNKGILWR